MEITKSIISLALTVAVSFLLIASWSLPAFTAEGNSSKATVKARTTAVKTNGAKLIKPRIAEAQPVQAAANQTATPYNQCVPAYTWFIPAGSGAAPWQGVTDPQRTQQAVGANTYQQQNVPQVVQGSGVSPCGYWYSTWVPCVNPPAPSWNAPAAAGQNAMQWRTAPPAQGTRAPNVPALAPQTQTATPYMGCPPPFQWLSAYGGPC